MIKRAYLIYENNNITRIIDYLGEKGVSCFVEKAQELADFADGVDFDENDCLIYLGNSSDLLEKAFDMAKKRKMTNAVYVGNAFSYFNRAYPEMKLAERHEFVRDTVNAVDKALSYSSDMRVAVLEVPFWDGLPDEFNKVSGALGFFCKKFALAPSGGCVEISAQSLAEAIYAAMENGESGVNYPVCDSARKYKEILADKFTEGFKIFEYPEEFAPLTALIIRLRMKKQGKTPKFNLKSLYSTLFLENLYFNAAEVKKALGYVELGLKIEEDCPDDTENADIVSI